MVGVYTPPQLRGSGYANGCVAALSIDMLRDRRWCFLHTDRANPTTNAIYGRLGYRPVSDAGRYRFTA
ncbi:MAG: GNAT family N-acetyltransferase [Egibacteraceae bacterium]